MKWYRQFWPWFLILLPATSVVGGISLVVIATKNADSVVADTWYKDGRGINRSMEAEQLAARLGISLVVEPTDTGLRAVLRSETPIPPPPALALALRHPTLAERDQVVELLHDSDGVYRAGAALPDGRWVITLSPPEGNWRLYDMAATIRDGQLNLARGG